MGNAASNVSRYVVRKVRRFNVENRAAKYLDKKVITAAPKPQATMTEMKKIREDFPNLMDEINKEDPNLNERLKKVYVSSTSDTFQEFDRRENPSRPLPAERGPGGTPQPSAVTPGRVSLEEAVQLLLKHHSDKSQNTAQKLADEYNLKLKDTENLLDYFKMFRMISEKEKELAGLSPPQSEEGKGMNIQPLKLFGGVGERKK